MKKPFEFSFPALALFILILIGQLSCILAMDTELLQRIGDYMDRSLKVEFIFLEEPVDFYQTSAYFRQLSGEIYLTRNLLEQGLKANVVVHFFPLLKRRYAPALKLLKEQPQGDVKPELVLGIVEEFINEVRQKFLAATQAGNNFLTYYDEGTIITEDMVKDIKLVKGDPVQTVLWGVRHDKVLAGFLLYMKEKTKAMNQDGFNKMIRKVKQNSGFLDQVKAEKVAELWSRYIENFFPPPESSSNAKVTLTKEKFESLRQIITAHRDGTSSSGSG